MTIEELEKLADQLYKNDDDQKRWMADAIRNRIKNNDPRLFAMLNYRNGEELIISMQEQYNELTDDDHYGSSGYDDGDYR